MARKRADSAPEELGNFSEINAIIARFLKDVAKDFNEFSDVGPKSQPIIYGFNVRIGPNGEPVINSFGNVRPSKPKVNFSEEREPLIDIIDVENIVTVLAEMPGIDRKSIRVTAAPDEIVIEAREAARNYYKAVRLPTSVDPTKSESRFHNGVLQLDFKKSAKTNKTAVIRISD